MGKELGRQVGTAIDDFYTQQPDATGSWIIPVDITGNPAFEKYTELIRELKIVESCQSPKQKRRYMEFCRQRQKTSELESRNVSDQRRQRSGRTRREDY